MKSQNNYTGIVTGDARNGNAKKRIKLRQTKMFWVSESGAKFRKSDGSGTGDWPLWSLDINSIKEEK